MNIERISKNYEHSKDFNGLKMEPYFIAVSNLNSIPYITLHEIHS